MMKRRSWVLWMILIVFLVVGCGRREEIEEFKAQWIRLKHEPIEEAKSGGNAPIDAEIEVSEDIGDVSLYVYYTPGEGPEEFVKMDSLHAGRYFATIPDQPRGTLVSYYIQATAGRDLAVRVPPEAKQPGFEFYFKGTPNRTLLISHVVLMFIALALFIIAGYLAFRAVRDRQMVIHIPRLAFLGTVLFFISSIPLGMIVGYQTYGKPWTGFPIGNDLTDNKSLVILLYWIAAAFLYRGSIFKKDPNGDLLGMKPLPYIYLVGVVLTIVLFALPH